MAPWAAAATLAVLAASSQALGKRLLPPPRNLSLTSKDFSLFLTWLPGAGYPPGVFYTVQWTNVYITWEDFLPCRNITETVCNITCISPDVHHSFDVRLKAQGSAGTVSSAWVNLENIDYEVNVTLAPPVLQVRKMGDKVVVNATFADPLCLKTIFSDLTSDLEFWEAGADNRKRFNMKNAKDFDATVFSGSDYCFSARAVLNNVHSNFSEPTCVQLHREADTWAFAAVPVLLLFILFVCIVLSLYQSRNRPVKSPQALDFSSSKGPKKFLEFTKKEFVSVLTFPGHPAVVENRSRLAPRMHSRLVPSVLEEYEDEEEEEEDEGTDSSRPYTELCRFQKNDMHSQVVGLGEKGSDGDGCSESDSSQLGEGSMPDLIIPGFFVSTNSVLGERTSGFQGSEMASLSADFSSEESSVCPDSYPIAQREDLDEGIDFLFQLSHSTLPTGKLFMLSEGFHEASCGALGDPQISLFGVQSNQDFGGLLLEDEKLSETDSSGCGRPMVNLSPSKVPSREGLESNGLGGNTDLLEESSPEPKSHGYRPRPMHYLSRILQG